MDKAIKILDARRLCIGHVGQLLTADERQRRRCVGIDRRQGAQQRPRACDHDHLPSGLQRMRRLHTPSNGGKIRVLLVER